MFEIDKKYLTKTQLPIIVKDYNVLVEYDEDILFIGKNTYDNWILGSIIEEDEDRKRIYYFHSIIDYCTYIRFIKRELSYRQILIGSIETYLIEKNFDRKIENIYNILSEEIPPEFLPFENTYYPVKEKKYTLDYVVRLKGKLADLHKAYVEDLTEIQIGFEKLFKVAFSLIKDSNIKPTILQEALAPTSIRLGYELTFEKGLFPIDVDIARYLSSFVEYALLYLPEESEIIFEKFESTTDNYNNLLNDIKKVNENCGVVLSGDQNERIKRKLYSGITELENIGAYIGTTCDEIEIYNRKGDSEEPIGIIDYKIKEEIENVLTKKNIFNEQIFKDTIINNYKIFIYHLNLETRNGNAIIFKDENKTEWDKPKIKIMGDEPLQKTKFTKSLHEKKEIEVKGFATKRGDDFKFIEIEFEK